jgi:hypothetical protein
MGFTIGTTNLTNTKVTKATTALNYSEEVYEDGVGGGGELIPNPQTREEFLEEKLLNYVKESYKAYVIDTDVQIARENANTTF